MKYKTLLKANLKRHKSGLVGIFILILIAGLSLTTALGVWVNASSYVNQEMVRMGFGDLTAWVSGIPDTTPLTEQILSQPDVEKVETQPLIHASYTINQQDSDSKGQLILYEPEEYPYKIFTEDLSTHQSNVITIAPGEIYLSPAMTSIFNAQIGDEIRFSISRSSGEQTFIVKGFFEDPFMGSAMMGMKSFLIGQQDFNQISQNIQTGGIDALARVGAMLHLFQTEGSNQSVTQWNSALNQGTALSQFTEFAHSKSAIANFMLLLQNIFTGFLLVFVGVFLVVSLLLLGHTINSAIQRDRVDMGILKGIGFTTNMLRSIQLRQYLIPIIGGMMGSLLLALPLLSWASNLTITTTGMMTPSFLPMGLSGGLFIVILCVLCGFITLKTAKIGGIRPLEAIRGQNNIVKNKTISFPIHQKGLAFWIAVRQLTNGKKQYLSALSIAILLVFLASTVGRVNTWLGTDGKGLMDAFNPAEHDIGVQRFGQLSWDEIEKIILERTTITDRYVLAMPGVTVNGVDYTANVIDTPQRFHILEGRSCLAENEVVLTEVAAADLKVEVGGSVSVSGVDYTVSGIYQCANDMGANIGMSREGYAKIGQDTPEMWCTHYFIGDTNQKEAIMQTLTQAYGGDVHLHENSWPGLYGIIRAMDVLIKVMYTIIALVILIVMLLISEKILAMESQNLGIYKTLGFRNKILRRAFVLRFTLVALIGSGLGLLLSALVTDSLVSMVMRQYGISNFSGHPSFLSVVLPGAVITLLFTLFSFMVSGKIAKINGATLSEL